MLKILNTTRLDLVNYVEMDLILNYHNVSLYMLYAKMEYIPAVSNMDTQNNINILVAEKL